jgi:LysR family nod box-dependent transcriptional activator
LLLIPLSNVLLSHVVAEVAKSAPRVTFEFLSSFAHEINISAKGGADMMMLEAYLSTPL